MEIWTSPLLSNENFWLFTYIKQSVGFKKNYPEVIEFINSIIFEAIEDGYIKNSLQTHNVDKKLSIPKSN